MEAEIQDQPVAQEVRQFLTLSMQMGALLEQPAAMEQGVLEELEAPERLRLDYPEHPAGLPELKA